MRFKAVALTLILCLELGDTVTFNSMILLKFKILALNIKVISTFKFFSDRIL